MTEYSLHTPDQVARDIADRSRHLRLQRGWKQSTLAKRSGVSLASLRRFEKTGKVSVQNLLEIAFALHRLDDFASLMKPPPASSIAELEAAQKRKRPKRGHI